jgi:hypothetical protein
MITKPAADFFTPPTRTIRLSREVGAKVRESLNLSADAPVEDIAQKLDELGEAAKAKEAGHKLVSVQRRGPLTVPPVVRKGAKLMRAVSPARQKRMR